MPTTAQQADRGERFRAVCTWLAARLPGSLSAFIPPSALGFAIVGGFTFSVDLLVLAALRSGAGLPLGLAVSVAYAAALALNFVLNRWLTFDARRRVGRQVVLYLAAVVVNYAGIVLGVTVGLTALGVPYPVARVVAGALEATFLYCAQRWVVFARDRGAPGA